ncbi:hypothetical protein O181_107583 [Austropuccinia psidii MF-1]|uniref:Uncharacterized protein n=1 Tax=Austropuccinia psidii MF-1 TaxID=1389203 RepID=A0A9Q3JSR6_9BASI|nr:hypothetical protein [Austropuccinia psidii MF-1]
MKPPLLINLGFTINQPDHWPRRHRGTRQPITGSDDQKGTRAQGLIAYQIKPTSPTRGLDIWRAGHTNPEIPQIPLHIVHGQKNVQYGIIMGRLVNNNPEDLSQQNDLDRPHKRKESLESQQELQALRRKEKQNQREPGSHTSHREILPHGTAQSNSGAQDMEEEAISSPQQSRSFRPYKPRENSSKAHK